MKTFTFHLDMIIAVVVLLLISVGANVYQWQTHGELHSQYIKNKEELTNNQVSLINTKKDLKDCTGETAAAQSALPLD